jgi:hypothetical protein
LSAFDDELQSRGWATTVTRSQDALLELAREFGTVRASAARRSLVDILTVRSAQAARRNTHSAAFGEGAFPFHTECAHWSVPARYILLRASREFSRPTRVLNLSEAVERQFRSVFEAALFFVLNGSRSFLAQAWDSRARRLRYNPTCMRPATATAVTAAKLMTVLIREPNTTRIDWTAGKTLIVDNWRCVHARGETSDAADPAREIARVLVEQGE